LVLATLTMIISAVSQANPLDAFDMCSLSDTCSRYLAMNCECRSSQIDCNLLVPLETSNSIAPVDLWKCGLKTALALNSSASPGLIALLDSSKQSSPFHHRQKFVLTQNRGGPLVRFPPNFWTIFENNSSIKEIELRGLHLSHLNESFRAPIGLQMLHIHQNSLPLLVSPLVFRNLTQLQTLDLVGNQIVRLPVDLFVGLSQLNILDLSFNPIDQLPDNIFAPLVRLEQLVMRNNRLTRLDPNLFAGLSQVRLLDLSYNALFELNSSPFASLVSCNELLLTHNSLSRIQSNTFVGMSSLKRLDLSFNRLTWFEISTPSSGSTWNRSTSPIANRLLLHSLLLHNNKFTGLAQQTFEPILTQVLDTSGQLQLHSKSSPLNSCVTDVRLIPLIPHHPAQTRQTIRLNAAANCSGFKSTTTLGRYRRIVSFARYVTKVC
jgi:Leucine-rich repeat (LRR) protein